MKSEILNACDQLVAGAANGVYQGLIIAALVALALRMLGRTNAATRHALWFCTLLLLVGLVVAHCLVDSFSLQRVAADDLAPLSNTELEDSTVPEIAARSSRESTNLADDPLASSEEPSRSGRHPLLAALIQAHLNSAEGVSEAEPPDANEPSHAKNDEGSVSYSSGEATGFRQLMDRLLNPIPVELPLGSKFPRFGSIILLALWLMIGGFKVLTLILQLVRIQKLKQQSLPPGAELSRIFQKLSAQLVTSRKVKLRVSPAHRSSFLLGFLHPVVLLPAEESMELSEAELVLRHELAHLERRDDWVNLIQHFLFAIFFFHPAFWWISKQMSLEREVACDDHVLHQSKRPQAYALVLANLAARMQKRLPLLAPGSSNSKTQLKERIDMILNTNRNASPRPAKTWLALITSTAALAAVAVICMAPRIVLAQIETTATGATITPPADVLPVVPVTEVVPVASVAGLPNSGSADNLPPTPPLPAAVSAAPKYKSGGSVTLSTSPAVITAPTISLAPMTTRLSVTAVPSQPPVLAAIEVPSPPRAQPAPRPTPAPRPGNKDSSLEDRLDRLERMVNSMLNQQNPKGRSDYQLKLEKDGMIDRKELAKIEALAKEHAELVRKINPQEIEKIKEQAHSEAKRSVEQTKRATAEVEKARNERAHKADQRQTARKLKADSQRQLEALRRQVETLERQREKLDREIEKLEQDQDPLDEQDDDSADIDTEPGESKEVCVTASHSHSAQ